MAQRHIVIVGGGIIGVCCAYFLIRRGLRVTLLERDRIGRAASYGNAGSVAPGHGPLNRPGRTLQALRFMFDETSPLYVAPRADPALARWLWSFHRHSTAAHLDHCMGVLGPLGHASQQLYDEIVVRERLDCGYRRDGYYEVFRTEAGLADARHEAARLRQLGYAPRALSGAEMLDREPALSRQVRGAVLHEEASTMDPYRFVTALAAAVTRAGGELRCECAVDRVIEADGAVCGVETASGERIEADRVILATGAYSRELLRRLGRALPIQPAKGYHRDSVPGPGSVPALRVACLLAESYIFCTPMGEFVRLAGTLEFSGLNHDVRASRLAQLTRGAESYFEQIGPGATCSEWVGLRPCLPDGLPVVGEVSGVGGLYVANGHAMMGLTLGPVTGRLIADAIVDGGDPAMLSALTPDRFRRRL